MNDLSSNTYTQSNTIFIFLDEKFKMLGHTPSAIELFVKPNENLSEFVKRVPSFLPNYERSNRRSSSRLPEPHLYLTRCTRYDLSSEQTELPKINHLVQSAVENLKKDSVCFYINATENQILKNYISTMYHSNYYNSTNLNMNEISHIFFVRRSRNIRINSETKIISLFPSGFIEALNPGELVDLSSYFQNSPFFFPFFQNVENPFIMGKTTTKLVNFTASSKPNADIFFVPQEHIQQIKTLMPDSTKILKFKKLLKGSGLPERAHKIYEKEAYHTGYGFLPYVNSDSINLVSSDFKFDTYSFVGLMTFMNSKTVVKYQKGKAHLYKLFTYSQLYNGEFFFDPEQFSVIKAEAYKDHLIYSNKLLEIFPAVEEFPELEVASTSKIETNFSPFVTIAKDKKCSEIKKISEAVKSIKQKLEVSESYVAHFDRNKNSTQRNITSKKVRLQEYQTYIESLTAEILEKEEELKKMDVTRAEHEAKIHKNKKVLESLEPTRNKLQSEFEDYLTNMVCDSSDDKFSKNLEAKGIHIEAIEYIETATSNVISVKTNPEIMFKAKADYLLNPTSPKYSLHQIQFYITKPLVVRVDPIEKGEDCPKIAVGPLKVTCTSNSVLLSPLTSNCLFGTDGNGNFWLHPHTSSFSPSASNPEVFMKRFMNRSQNGCLGEASSAFYNAAKERDPRQLIIAAMTWLTSANSSDVWGRNYKYFEPLSSLKLESSIDVIQKHKERVAKMIQDSEELHNAVDQTLGLASTEPNHQSFEEFMNGFNRVLSRDNRDPSAQSVLENSIQNESTETDQVQEEPVASSLRQAGVAGYVPLYRQN